MFGWEFPPHIAGGLGTACYGLTRGLAKHDVGVIFVVPKAYGDEDGRFVRVVNASDVEVSADDTREKEIWEKLTFIHVDSNMVPYVSPEEFDDYSRQFRETGELPGATRRMERALCFFREVRAEPDGGSGALCDGRRADRSG